MAFLDQKEDVIDIVLTDRGRELFAKNQLNFVYYAFSDEGINYSGSLEASGTTGITFDNYVHRNLPFEADGKFQSPSPGAGGFVGTSFRSKNKDLESFLFTVPPDKKVLPTMTLSTSSSITLDRKFYIDKIVLQNRNIKFSQKPLDIVVRATTPKRTLQDRISEYVLQQRFKNAFFLLGNQNTENG